ncbi:MAG: hypothetical protein SGCHY_002725 [Lobulomycetales sp.]
MVGHDGWATFELEYNRTWLHSAQVVSIDANALGGTGKRIDNVTVSGLDLKSGLLRATADDATEYLLQPDGNSFDMMKGLIKRKK